MFTFLFGEYRRKAIRGYRERLFVMYLGIGFATLFAACALFVPAYLLSAAKRDAILVPDASLSEKAKAESKAIEGEVRALKEKLSYAKADADNIALSSVLERIGARREPGISITSVALRRGAEKGAISISGKAATRDALVSFSKSLQGEPSFGSVNLPVSSLAKSKDIPFSISIDSKF